MTASNIVKAGIIQAEPVYYDLDATVEKALDLLHDAANLGAQVITFGETWFPGYPKWLDECSDAALWGNEATKDVFLQLHANSPTVNGEAIGQLRQAATQLGVVLVLSINERVDRGPGNHSLYNTLLTVDTTGEIVNHHRKLVPTYTERLVWGAGDADGLGTVDTAVGRVGGLICWEHWMPMTRQVMHDSAEQIHIAVWPTVDEMHQVASRHYAFEGRTFVLAAGTLLRAGSLPETLTPAVERPADALLQRGGSAIIGPDGTYLAGPVYDEETILTADLDLNAIIRESMTLDVTGHYARRELFTLNVKSNTR